MSNRWTVKPEERRVEIELDGEPHWLLLKKYLTEGEKRRVMTAGWRGVKQAGESRRGQAADDRGAEISIDWQTQTFARTLTYVSGWSLQDDRGVTLPRTIDVIESLREEIYEPIETAITKHIEEMAEEKKAMSGRPVLRATSA